MSGRKQEANRALLTCCSELTEQSRKLRASLRNDSVVLAQSISALLQEFTLTMATEDAGPPIVTGTALWTDAAPRLQDLLLQVGQNALSTQPDIAVKIADTVLAARPGSRAAWRLRARALGELGDLAGAIEAHEGYLSRISSDTMGVAQTVQQLRRRIAATDELAEALTAELAGGPEVPDGVGSEELWDAGFRLEHSGRWPEARAHYLAATRLMIVNRAVPSRLASAVDQVAAKTVHHEYDRITQSQSLISSLTAFRRAGETALMDAELASQLQIIGIGDFRNLVSGKTVCLVANSERVAAGRHGSMIDSYDLVVRFNSYAIDPPATGRKTDVHATIHLHDFNWDKHVPIRLILSGNHGAWRRSMKQRLVPGAQDYVGDGTLRWPVRDSRFVDDQEIPGIPTSGFNIMRLLDFLDVNPVIDLIGFDFYETGPYRLKEAMGLAVSPMHSYEYEKAWVMRHARATDEMRISLR